jgi:NSS family neurotransmitter:Na+ symporter
VKVAEEASASPVWGLAAYFGIVAAILVMSFYFVITGWILYYAWQMIGGQFAGASASDVSEAFKTLTLNESNTVIWHGLAAISTWAIVAAGLRNGIERSVRYLMPLLLVFLILITVYAASYGNLSAALDFLFRVRWEDVSAKTVWFASGQAFFTLGAGSCVMIAYGSYLPRSVSIMKSSLQIVAADTGVALLAGIAIFPLVFAFDLKPAEGPGLLFVTLPIIFSQSSAGSFIGAAFFIMVAIAAITSAIAIVQPPILWAQRVLHTNRMIASTLTVFIIWLLGFGTICSFSSCSGFYPLEFIPFFREMTVFAVIEMIAINICLPAGALVLAIFAGWRVPFSITADELQGQSLFLMKLWLFIMRCVIPPAIVLIMVFGFTAPD